MRYYRKLVPKTKLVLDNNTAILFSTIDGITGYYSTNDQYVQAQFLKMMQNDVGGISEISELEFMRDYIDKKKQVGTTQLPSWRREELGGHYRPTSPLQILGVDAVVKAVGVTKSDVPVRMEEPPRAVEPRPETSAPEEGVQVNLGKRTLK